MLAMKLVVQNNKLLRKYPILNDKVIKLKCDLNPKIIFPLFDF